MTSTNRKKERHKQYMREKWKTDPIFRQKHLERVKRNKKKYAAEVDKILTNFKKDGCSICEEKAFCCMSAHHLDPSKKDFSIASGRRRSMSARRFIEELKKCICVCENCHRKIHAGLIFVGSSNGKDVGPINQI